MTLYEEIVKLEKNYRRGIRPEMFIFGLVPVIALVTMFWDIFFTSESTAEKLSLVLGLGFFTLIFVALGVATVYLTEKGKSPKTVEADFEMMRESIGLPDTESFNEMLEQMARYEKFVFVDHRYLLDFRSLSVIPINSILRVEIGQVRHRRNYSYFVWVFADEQLKIKCSRKSGQEKLFNALNLALMEKNTMNNRGRSIPKAKWEKLQSSGNAEMEELNFKD